MKGADTVYYENMPLYPGMKPACGDGGCMKVRVFDEACGGCCHPPAMRECERVWIENPCRPGERAEVTLGVDDCGSLVICVRRDCPGPCPMPRRGDWRMACRATCRMPRERCHGL